MVYLNGLPKGIVLKEERRSAPCPSWAPYLPPLSCLADAPKGVDIVLSPSGRNILPGDRVTLTCRVNSSYPEVSSVQWVKDGMQLKAQSHVLQLSQAGWDDAGVYTCQAENGVGSSVSPPVSLPVFSESWVSLGLDQRAGRGPGHWDSGDPGESASWDVGVESQPFLREMTNLPGREGW